MWKKVQAVLFVGAIIIGFLVFDSFQRAECVESGGNWENGRRGANYCEGGDG